MAKFVLCPGGDECPHDNKNQRHGYLIPSQAEVSHSPPFYSQEVGVSYLLGGVTGGFITSDEAPDLKAEITASGLPAELTDADRTEFASHPDVNAIEVVLNNLANTPLGALIGALVGATFFIRLAQQKPEECGFEYKTEHGRYTVLRHGCDVHGRSAVALYIDGKLEVESPDGTKIATVGEATAFLAESALPLGISVADLAALAAKLSWLFPPPAKTTASD